MYTATTYTTQLLREARIRSGIEWSQISPTLGVTPEWLTAAEQGTQPVTFDELLTILRCLHLDVPIDLTMYDTSEYDCREHHSSIIDALEWNSSFLQQINYLQENRNNLKLESDKIISILNKHKFDYVLIGGLAAVVHGSPFPTRDMNVAPARTLANMQCLTNALKELDAKIRTSASNDNDPGLAFSYTPETLMQQDIWNFVTKYGWLDISFTQSGIKDYKDWLTNSKEQSFNNNTVRVATLDAIVRSKQVANREKDRRVLPVLREILAHKA